MYRRLLHIISLSLNIISLFFFYAVIFVDVDFGNFEEKYYKMLLLLIGIILFFISFIINNFRIKLFNELDGYGYKNNKTIDIKNISMFRDVPCNGNIYYAYILIKLNNFKFKNSNILGAIILKWIKDGKVFVKKKDNNNVIKLIKNSKFNYQFENELFKMIYESSENGILEIKEFEEWVKNYDMRFLGLFAKMEDEIINLLKKETHIYYRINEEECIYQYVMDDKIYEDSIKLYGFKIFLEHFSSMDDKEVKELHLWENYLIFATLFGITDKVNKQLKDLYPDIEEIDMYDLI